MRSQQVLNPKATGKLLKIISRIVPVISLLSIALSLFLRREITCTFSFQSPEEFEPKAKEAVLYCLPSLAGKSFHVRMHRRGFKGRISSPEEERFLDRILIEELAKIGNPGRITFEQPDAILVVETLGQQAGLSGWNRQDLQRYPLLRLD